MQIKMLLDWRKIMEIDLNILEYKFKHKPLLIGGKAMEYYGLRKAGLDIDLVINNSDHKILDLFDNPVGCRTSPAVFQAKALQNRVF